MERPKLGPCKEQDLRDKTLIFWRKFQLAISIALSVTMLIPAVVTGQMTWLAGAHVPGELLIVPKDGFSEDEIVQLYQSQGGKKLRKLSQIKAHHVKLPPHLLDAAEASLKKNPKIKTVERNYLAEATLIPNDPGFTSQWHLSKISAPAGWDITVGSLSVPIAIIDSGVDSDHPDLLGKILPGFNFVRDNADTRDAGGHGTAVAGAAAALTNSGIGVAGVAWDNPIMPLSVFDESGYATYADVAEAVIYAADHGAKVINVSLGGPRYSVTLQNAVDYAWNKGAVIVASAGNDGTSEPIYPAALDNVIAVAATDKEDRLASFSSFGGWLDVAAPGTSIYTTSDGGGYGFWQGTSFSAPLVSGLTALLFSLNPNLTNAQILNILISSADDLGAIGYDNYFGYGRINVARALGTALTLATIRVEITSPQRNDSVGGLVPIDVSASGDLGIAKVELYVDDVLSGTVTTAPYTFLWDASGLTGPHSIVAKAYDGSGQQASSSAVEIMVVPPDALPNVQITGVAILTRRIIVSVTAFDPDGDKIKNLQLYLDGALAGKAKRNSKNFKINTKRLSLGSTHTLQARATDANGNVGTSLAVTFTR